MTTAPTFGEEIRRLRKEKGLTQRAFAEEVGIDFTYLSKIETGSLPPPSEAAISRMATVVDGDAEDLSATARKIPHDLQRTLNDAPVDATIIVRRLRKMSAKQLKAMRKIADRK